MTNQMKMFFILCSTCILFELIGIEKIYINDGVMSYCRSPQEPNSATILHSIDFRSNMYKKSYLPITTVPEIDAKNDGNKQIINFPLAWNGAIGGVSIICHDLYSDSIGRITFVLLSIDQQIQ